MVKSVEIAVRNDSSFAEKFAIIELNSQVFTAAGRHMRGSDCVNQYKIPCISNTCIYISAHVFYIRTA